MADALEGTLITDALESTSDNQPEVTERNSRDTAIPLAPQFLAGYRFAGGKIFLDETVGIDRTTRTIEVSDGRLEVDLPQDDTGLHNQNRLKFWGLGHTLTCDTVGDRERHHAGRMVSEIMIIETALTCIGWRHDSK